MAKKPGVTWTDILNGIDELRQMAEASLIDNDNPRIQGFRTIILAVEAAVVGNRIAEFAEVCGDFTDRNGGAMVPGDAN